VHDDQLDVPLRVARVLVDEQFPRWSGLALRAVESAGTVNALFRLGEELALRFPLRAGDPDAVRREIEREQAATGELAAAVTVAAPRPVAVGEPGAGYPLPWSVQTWVPGTIATDARVDRLASSDAFAGDLAALIAELRAVPTRGRSFDGTGRGGALRHNEAWMEHCFAQSEGLIDVATVRAIWNERRDLPRLGDDVMTHGDLIPTNVLVVGERVSEPVSRGRRRPRQPAARRAAPPASAARRARAAPCRR
jgi:aminoglycoside phosphotransferase (APT) family kinase protein